MNVDFIQRPFEYEQLETILAQVWANRTNNAFKHGVYICGKPGVGKTSFVLDSLKQMGYGVIRFDVNDVGTNAMTDTMCGGNVSDKNAMSLMRGRPKQNVVVLDDIESISSVDKSVMTTLATLIKPVKSVKSKRVNKKSLHKAALNVMPIICIGEYNSVDKKSSELMKMCHVLHLKPFTDSCIQSYIVNNYPHITSQSTLTYILNYASGDLRKLHMMIGMVSYTDAAYAADAPTNTFGNTDAIVQRESFFVNVQSHTPKQLVRDILCTKYSFDSHKNVLNETDRTIVSLLWHENVIDIISHVEPSSSVVMYKEMLNSICFADYIDRITFQKQIWQFSEMSSILKTFRCNCMLHMCCTEDMCKKFASNDMRFTKVLTKYSTEYNNFLFVQSMCQKLSLDKRDTLAMFVHMNSNTNTYSDNAFRIADISNLDIQRMYRYIKSITGNESELEMGANCNENIKDSFD